MLAPVHLSEGLRFFRRRLGFSGFRRFDGDAFAICREVVDACWNGRFLQVSSGHYRQVYARDLGWCAPALLALGHRDRVLATLSYAFERWSRAGRITVAITPSGRPFDFPSYPSLDSIAYVFNTLRLVHAKDLVEQHRPFLKSQVRWVASLVQDDGLPRPIRFSGMRDYAIRQQSCYDTAALGLLSRCLDDLRLQNPLPSASRYAKLLKSHFWTGRHFRDDLSGKDVVTADANIYPFWWGIIKSGKMLKSAVRSLQSEGLDVPFPLKYVRSKSREDKMLWMERFVSGWERDAIWSHMAMPYIELLASFDKRRAKEHLRSYASLIERHGTYVEVFAPSGEPFKTPFYVADEGMLWASQFLYVARKIGFRG